jgi:CRP-like cAMP-binding protein
MRTAPARTQVLAEDPDLAERIPPSERDEATRLIVADTLSVPAGDWEPAGELGDIPSDPAYLGLLVVEGLVIRGIDLEGAGCSELLGVGDLLRPWYDHRLAEHSIASQATWRVVEPVRAAVLDPDVARAMGRWPQLTAALLDRFLQRTHTLTFHLAVCSIARLEVRLLAVLWNVADRWGKVGPNGVRVPLPLTHDVLAELVSARRPSVSAAIGRLRRRGLISTDRGVGYILHGDAPEELAHIRRQIVPGLPDPSAD